MGLLDSLLGGGPQAQGAQDFIRRYDQGAPHEGYDDREVLQQYQQVAPHLSQEQYQEAAEQAFARMSPQERLQFGQYLRSQAGRHDINFPDVNQDGVDDRLQDPHMLAQLTGRVHQQNPGLLGGLLGGALGGGGGFGSAIGGMLGGRSAGGGAGALGSQGAQVLDSPIAKAAMAGIAAMAMRNLMGRRR